MAQAFVQKVFSEQRTLSTIQVPSNAQSSIDEIQVKNVLLDRTQQFFRENIQFKDISEKCYQLASVLNKTLISKCECVDNHKIVVHVTISEQWGQGLKSIGRCLWDENCDRVISTNVKNKEELFIISAFFIRIQDESSDEENDDFNC